MKNNCAQLILIIVNIYVNFEVQSKLIIMTFMTIKLRLHWVFLNDI
jgi:hypothetical protein